MEVLVRRILYRLPRIKKRIKTKQKKTAIKERKPYDEEKWSEYKNLVDKSVDDNSIILVHASMDGLRNIGVDEEAVFSFLAALVSRGITVVSTAYPITNWKIKEKRMKPYNPEKTPCWTGMLSNRFVSDPSTIRSIVPYNTLAAIGPQAKAMMYDNLDAEYVYGDHTPWKYCVDHHARILFIGTTCLDSNTIQTHMLADFMGDRWPIDNWYAEYEAPVIISGERREKKIKIQDNFWTQFVADYASTKKIKKAGYLKEYSVSGCPFGYITDSYDMVKYLEAECNKGKLMYVIPKKYWKKGWKKKQ